MLSAAVTDTFKVSIHFFFFFLENMFCDFDRTVSCNAKEYIMKLP